MSDLAQRRRRAALAAFKAWASYKDAATARQAVSGDLIRADRNPDLPDDATDFVADFLIFAKGLGLDPERIVRLASDHAHFAKEDAEAEDLAARGRLAANLKPKSWWTPWKRWTGWTPSRPPRSSGTC